MYLLAFLRCTGIQRNLCSDVIHICIFSLANVNYTRFIDIFQVTESAKTAANGEITEYKSLVNYAGTLADTLLFIHYVAVLLIEVRHLQPTFYLKVREYCVYIFDQ